MKIALLVLLSFSKRIEINFPRISLVKFSFRKLHPKMSAPVLIVIGGKRQLGQ